MPAEEFELNRSGDRARMEHIIFDEQFKEELGLRNQIYEGILTEKETDMVLKFAEHGLPDLTERKWWGLDGHHYEIKILQKEISCMCWRVLPKQWKKLGQMIDICIEKADPDVNVYGYDIQD